MSFSSLSQCSVMVEHVREDLGGMELVSQAVHTGTRRTPHVSTVSWEGPRLLRSRRRCTQHPAISLIDFLVANFEAAGSR